MSIAEAMERRAELKAQTKWKIEGKIEGKVETTVQFVKGLVKMGMDAATIAQTFDLSKDEVEVIIANM